MEKEEIKKKEDEAKNTDAGSGSFEDFMREKARIEKGIKEKFVKKMTLIFSDMVGSTVYVDKKGDIAGRAWMQQHHDIALPLIEKHEGRILLKEGDGYLASFQTALSAVKASVAVQKALKEHNKETDPADEIHVRIGINTGEILVSENDVAGIAVHVAKRIETEAEPDQVLISRTAYEDVRGSEDVLCRLYKRNVKVKGVEEPLELYSVVWQDEETVISEAPLIRSDRRADKKPIRTLHLDLSREKDRIKISVSEQTSGELNTVRHYEEIPVPMDKIGLRCREITETLNNANRNGRLTREVLMRLREVGQIFRDELFTVSVKKKMEESRADHLILHLDDQLVHIPWELLHDGKQFLCQRFNMGRLVATRQNVPTGKSRVLARPLKMLALTDPKGDLKGAYEEGRQIRDFMDRDKDLINVSLLSSGITPDFIRGKLRNFDLVHFAGHADYNPENPGMGGWRLSEGTMTAQDISRMVGTAAMPALIFSNACQSARTEEWGLKEHFQNEIFGLANAFILAGVKHYVGTFWEILDESSRLFALEFYKQLISGLTIGEAVRQARLELIDKFGEETIVWASYLLYGDPTFSYMDQIQQKEAEPEPSRAEPPEEVSGVVRKEERISFDEEKPKKTPVIWWGSIAVIVILACLLWVYPGFIRTGIADYERSATAYYMAGDYPSAREVSTLLLEKAPERGVGYVILGNIFFREGDIEQAKSLFNSALESRKAGNTQKAEALMGLGRIASIQNDTEGAMKYYKQAATMDPSAGQAYSSQAVLLEQQGDYDNALTLFKKAQELSPDDYSLRSIIIETNEKASYRRDQEKRARIDKLVEELQKSAEEATPVEEWDGWTSFPMTIWLMDIERNGKSYSLEEGKEQMVAASIMGQLIEKGRGQVVERAEMDIVLEELKLSTTGLVDSNTELRLGRQLAARVILKGQAFHLGADTQYSIRIIDTETGEVKGSISKPFGSAAPASSISDKLSGMIVEKLNSIYPLRGKISEIKGDQIILNIGQREGVESGQQFRVKDLDIALEITDVEQDISTARPLQDAEGLESGMRVEAL